MIPWIHFTDLSTISIIFFLLGIILLIIEMFTPGFGIAGISGIILLIVDILLSAKTLEQGIWLAIALFLVIICLFFIFLYLAAHGKLPKKLVLHDEANKQNGFNSSKDKKELLNQIGVTATDLRPAGIAVFDHQRYDVVSHGEFIERHKNIVVINVEGNRIVVKEIKEV
ncbi:hypothetical protein SDC9_72796 [bioreactor metagenome]|uniref:Uncharacterized protein n=1 Tax=bioreactor metagenome TaxID=1076179 RepID=A0A644YCL7_9ZZZZ|nr:NfeD family protein [Erysipelotrichaceae bacterium]